MSSQRTITNPSPDQLKAGGRVSGTYDRLFHFEDQELTGRTIDDRLELSNLQPVVVNDKFGDKVFVRKITVTSYTPPEPKPWWETCPDDAWVAQRYVDRDSEIVYTAETLRRVFPKDELRAQSIVLRRVHVSDYATTVPVPRDALDELRVQVGGWARTSSYVMRIADFLRAVGERGE